MNTNYGNSSESLIHCKYFKYKYVDLEFNLLNMNLNLVWKNTELENLIKKYAGIERKVIIFLNHDMP